MSIDFRAIRRKFFPITYWRGNIKRYINHGGFDIPFLILLIALLTTGIVLMFSASYVNALYNAGAVNTNENPYFYFTHQLAFAVVGLVVMFAVSRIRIDVFADASVLAALVAFILLAAVFAFPTKTGKEDFYRWIDLPGLPSFQPSELAKIALILFLAWSMTQRKEKIEQNWYSIYPELAVIFGMCGLVALENHLSGTIIILSIGVVMTFLGGGKRWLYGAGICCAILGAFVLIKSGALPSYVKPRIEIWEKLLAGQELTKEETLGSGWQITQSLYAIGSGGLFGLGFGNSKQKHLYLPEPQNDFIYAIVCEELGYIRAIVIMLLFLLLVIRGFQIALRSKNRYGSLVAMGVCFQIGLEAVLNMAVVTATVPNTGISLPFFSYGGTAMVTLLAEMGLVLSVSRSAVKSGK